MTGGGPAPAPAIAGFTRAAAALARPPAVTA